jgi:hypothetical protein
MISWLAKPHNQFGYPAITVGHGRTMKEVREP